MSDGDLRAEVEALAERVAALEAALAAASVTVDWPEPVTAAVTDDGGQP